MNALQAAVRTGDVEVVGLLLSKGIDVNRDSSPLQATVLKDNIEVIQLPLDKGADVNIQGGRYGNVLQAAV